MVIPLGVRRLVSVKATALRAVRCEYCRCEFAYELTRRGSGMATSAFGLDNQGAKSRATTRAQADVARTLTNPKIVDPVPCPDCGRYQAAMVRKIRRDSWMWMTLAGWAMLTGALFSFFIALTYQHNPFTDTAFLSFIAAGVVCFAVQRLHASRLEPNADARPGGRSRAMRRSELEQYAESERSQGREFPLPVWT